MGCRVPEAVRRWRWRAGLGAHDPCTKSLRSSPLRRALLFWLPATVESAALTGWGAPILRVKVFGNVHHGFASKGLLIPLALKCIEQCRTGLLLSARQTPLDFVTSPRSSAGWGSLDTALLGVSGDRRRCFAGRCPVGCLGRALLRRRSGSLLARLWSWNPRRPGVSGPWTRTGVLRSPTDGRPLALPGILPRALPGPDLRASRRGRRIQHAWGRRR